MRSRREHAFTSILQVHFRGEAPYGVYGCRCGHVYGGLNSSRKARARHRLHLAQPGLSDAELVLRGEATA